MDNKLREIRINGHRLIMTATGYNRDGKTQIAYKLFHGKELIFDGNDFYSSPLHADDSDESVKALFCFLTLRPGDTDSEYFKDYSPTQIAWRDQYAEQLSYAVMDRFGE